MTRLNKVATHILLAFGKNGKEGYFYYNYFVR